MVNNKYICKFCGKEHESPQSLGGHLRLCKLNPNNKIKEFSKKRTENSKKRNPIIEYNLVCQVCNKKYTIKELKENFENGKYKHTCSRHCASILTYIHTDSKKRNEKISKNHSKKCAIKFKHKENNNWVENSEELNKELFIEKKQFCKKCGKEFIITEKNKKGYIINKSFCSEKCKHDFFSELAKKNCFGGYVENSIKKHHKGNYKGIHCDSSWELAYLVYCLEHNIEIERCKEKRTYHINGETKTYIPDFLVNKSKIVEIKGYHNNISKQKQKENPDITLLLKNDLKDILKYVTSKYGNNFWEILYE